MTTAGIGASRRPRCRSSSWASCGRGPVLAAPPRVERIADVFRAVGACWLGAGELAPTGQELTLRLSFKRNGEILGQPRVTYYKPGASPEERKPFTDSILAALDRCLPLPFSPTFGAAVAGRPFVLRFIDARRV
jgi:hypothetical protein